MSEPANEGERIAKRLARAGLCSRRDAERWIADGRVKVDGKVLETPACVVTDQSRIEVDGKPLPAAEPGAAVALSQADRRDGDRRAIRRAGRRSSTRCPRACPAWSRSAGSTSCRRACCC